MIQIDTSNAVVTAHISGSLDATAPPRMPRRQSWRRHPRLAAVTTIVVVATVFAPTSMSPVARLTLAIFTVMLSLTAFTKVNEVAVCTVALGALVLVGGSSVGDVTGAFTSHTVVLLVGAFVVAAATKRSGIAERLAFAIGGRARTVDQLMVRLTVVLIATAFVVPSTSGRAALMLPVYLAFAERINDRRVRRALAVLFPSVILLSAVASLFGAGAHLVMTELVAGVGADRIGFLQWTLYGLPFALVSSFTSLAVVRWMFLRRNERAMPIDLTREAAPWTRHERIVTVVLSGLTLCWLTEPVHRVPAWLAAVTGAVVVTAGPLRVTTLGQARAALPLDLLFVMAVTAEAGSALARTGAADWIAISLLGPLADRGASALLVVLVVGVVSLLAHMVVTSRTARAAVLLPVVILIGGAAGLDVTALAYLSTAAAGYCMSTTTSAKPIRVFSTVPDGYGEPDLRRMSVRLLPLHVVLLIGFAFFVWPLFGLAVGVPGQGGSAAAGSGESPAAALPWSPARIDGLGIGPRVSSSPVADAVEPEPQPQGSASPSPVPPTSTPAPSIVPEPAPTPPAPTVAALPAPPPTSPPPTAPTTTVAALPAPPPVVEPFDDDAAADLGATDEIDGARRGGDGRGGDGRSDDGDSGDIGGDD